MPKSKQKIQILNKALACFFAVSFFCCLAACGKKDPYLYDKPGFDPGAAPNNANNPNAPMKVAPDYYYRQPMYPQAAPQQYYPQQQQNPYQQPGYQQQVPPGSRYYSNPYAIPPSGGYYPQYDGDQYYVPPAYYNNVEPMPQSHTKPEESKSTARSY